MVLVGSNSIKLNDVDDSNDCILFDRYDHDEFMIDIFYDMRVKATVSINLESAKKLRDYLNNQIEKSVQNEYLNKR